MRLGELTKYIAGQLRDQGIETARLDAELIVAHAADMEREALLANADALAGEPLVALAEALEKRRALAEPMAYILGTREFWSLPFRVTPATLVPRPESETLIEAALDWAVEGNRPLRILDLGTGSAALLLTLLSEWPEATGVGIDMSTDALSVAVENAEALGLAERAQFLEWDWNDPHVPLSLGQDFDLVVANPPYIRRAELASLPNDVRKFEPTLALDGGCDGLDAYRAIIVRLTEIARPGAGLFLEIGEGQAAPVRRLLADAGFGRTKAKADLAGCDRIIMGTIPEFAATRLKSQKAVGMGA